MYRHVIVALDGSRLAEQALPHAEDLARAMGATLTLISCVEPYVITMPASPAPVPVYDVQIDTDTLIAERQAYLDSLKADLATRGIEADTVVCRGPAGEEIMVAAEARGADVIVMTTHGRSGLKRLIYGSVAEDVLHNSKTPVLLIRAKPAP